jgi:ribonuclease-3
MDDLLSFLNTLNIECKNPKYFEEAFTHRSYINERKSDLLAHNERIEFLGDAVLELIVTEYLFNTYPQRPEGELTSFRAAIVKTDSLASEAKKLGFGKYLRMSKGEEATGGKEKDYLLANTFEALLGAIYLDQGYEIAKEFINSHLLYKVEEIVTDRLDIDSKTKFQEIAQELFKFTPIYTVISEEGPDHDKVFTMAVMVGNKEYGRGKGSSKQRAEEMAATEGLKAIKTKE